MARLTLDQLVQYVQEIPALPDVAMKVLRMTEDPLVSAREVAAAVAVDVALTSRILKIANSAYYGMSRRISTVNEAVLLLGMRSLRSLALAAAAYDTLKQEVRGYSLPAGELWRHSVACALTSQVVAHRSRAAAAEEAFVAGLLHDVGKVVLNTYVGDQFQAILALVELEGIPFHEGEKVILGFEHAEVGARIAEKWNLPSHLCGAIAGHHDVALGGEKPTLAAVVHVANCICVTEGLGTNGDGLPPTFDECALSLLKLDEADVEALTAEAVTMVAAASNPLEAARA